MDRDGPGVRRSPPRRDRGADIEARGLEGSEAEQYVASARRVSLWTDVSDPFMEHFNDYLSAIESSSHSGRRLSRGPEGTWCCRTGFQPVHAILNITRSLNVAGLDRLEACPTSLALECRHVHRIRPLRAIRDNPDDDTVRLVYADCVEEDGDPARGEFIRVQVARARRRPTPARALETASTNSWRERGPVAWCALIRTGWWSGSSVAAVHEVAATPSFMLNEGDALRGEPGPRWRVQSAQGEMREDLCESGLRSWFARSKRSTSGWYSTIGELERFLTRSDFAQLRELDLSDRPGLDDLPGILNARVPRATRRTRVGGRYPGEAGQLDAELLAHQLGPAR